MKIGDLVGKNAIRTAPLKFNGDHSYMNTPLFIHKATASHIVVEGLSSWERGQLHVLNAEWLDDNWTNYDELMAGVVPIAVDEPKQELAN